MKKFLILALLIVLSACSNEQKVKQIDKVVSLTDASFKSEVIAAEGLIVVDFWAEWCGPCRVIKPYIHELANEYDGKVKVTAMDVDHNTKIARHYEIRSIPAVFFFKDGKVVETVVGARSKSEFKALFEKHM
ncbi:MAG: thioredoxin [Calditrichaeota bacterium]|nr:MAG: thioredoxin [Calditrichota bacterium]